MPVIRVDRSGEIATVVLNRPEAMNALSAELCDAIGRTFIDLAASGEVRAVVLTGEGRAFSAGVDLKELESGARSAAQLNARELIDSVREFPGPVIGAVNGFAITGGFELALACDFLIASTAARFADTHARVGILPGWGLSQKLPRLIGIGRAKELSLHRQLSRRGDRLRLGARQSSRDRARRIAADLPGPRRRTRSPASPTRCAKYKKLIDDGFAMTYGDALDHETRESAQTMRAITPEDVAMPPRQRAGPRPPTERTTEPQRAANRPLRIRQQSLHREVSNAGCS